MGGGGVGGSGSKEGLCSSKAMTTCVCMVSVFDFCMIGVNGELSSQTGPSALKAEKS